MKFCFGDIVVVDRNLIGVIVKSWVTFSQGNRVNNYDVYVRTKNGIENYKETEIERYMVRHKYLDEDEEYYQANAILGIWGRNEMTERQIKVDYGRYKENV